MNIKKVVYLCCAVALATFIATATFTYYYVTSKNSGSEVRLSDQDYEAVKQFLDVGDLQKLINQYYYKSTDTKSLVDGALKGMVASLDDPYSAYYTQDEYQAYNKQNSGSFVGIGATVSKDPATDYLKVVNVHKGSPAETSGLKEQDMITKVDNVDVRTTKTDELDDLLQGPVGSTITLTVLHSGSTEPVVVNIVRAEVQAQYAFYTMLNKDIAEISITEFHGDVSKTFQDALNYIKDKNQNAKGLILDLRDNLGGSVNECIDIAKMILPKGLICYTLDKSGKRDEYVADSDQYNNIPLIVLVNGNSASASEILAGAIQDVGRGKLVGTQTYGKGVVQSVQDMPYSGGGVKLTSAVYYTPAGRNINGIGLTPDVTVELPEDVLSGKTALTAETDTQLKMAIDMMTQVLNGDKSTATPGASASASASAQ